MLFHWSRYDEDIEEYVFHRDNIVACVYSIIGDSEYGWYVRCEGQIKRDKEKSMSEAFEQAEQTISAFMKEKTNANSNKS